MKQILYNMKHGTEYLNYGREIIKSTCRKYYEENSVDLIHILDLGAGRGVDLINCRNILPKDAKPILSAIENYPPNVDILKKNGIAVYDRNIEHDTLPFVDREIDIVILNQVLEHTKEIFWIFGEISRVLKRGGYA